MYSYVSISSLLLLIHSNKTKTYVYIWRRIKKFINSDSVEAAK